MNEQPALDAKLCEEIFASTIKAFDPLLPVQKRAMLEKLHHHFENELRNELEMHERDCKIAADLLHDFLNPENKL